MEVQVSSLAGDVHVVHLPGNATLTDLLVAANGARGDKFLFGGKAWTSSDEMLSTIGVCSGATVQLVRSSQLQEVKRLEAELASLPHFGNHCQKYLRHLAGVPAGHPIVLLKLRLISYFKLPTSPPFPCPRFFTRNGLDRTSAEFALAARLVRMDEVRAAALAALGLLAYNDALYNNGHTHAERESECVASVDATIACIEKLGEFKSVATLQPDVQVPSGGDETFWHEKLGPFEDVEDTDLEVQSLQHALLSALEPHYNADSHVDLLTWILTDENVDPNLENSQLRKPFQKLQLVLAEAEFFISNGNSVNFCFREIKSVHVRQLDAYIALLKALAGDPNDDLEYWC